MTRTKKVETTIKDTAEADDVLLELARLQNQKKGIEVWMNKQQQKIQEEAVFKGTDDSGQTLGDRIAAKEANLLAFLEKNRDAFADKTRSVELNHGKIGFRLGTPKVTALGSMTMKSIMGTEALVKMLRKWGWIKEDPKMDKTQILADHADSKEPVLKKLRQVSLTVIQEDAPFVEPKEIKMSAARIEDKAA